MSQRGVQIEFGVRKWRVASYSQLRDRSPVDDGTDIFWIRSVVCDVPSKADVCVCSRNVEFMWTTPYVFVNNLLQSGVWR